MEKLKQQLSKTKIERRMRSKTNPILVDAIIKIKKKNPEAAKLLSRPVKKLKSWNLSELDAETKDGEKVFVAGKILSSGDLAKKIKVVAWNASESAKEKMKAAKVEFVTVVEEIKKNPELKDLRILN